MVEVLRQGAHVNAKAVTCTRLYSSILVHMSFPKVVSPSDRVQLVGEETAVNHIANRKDWTKMPSA